MCFSSTEHGFEVIETLSYGLKLKMFIMYQNSFQSCECKHVIWDIEIKKLLKCKKSHSFQDG